MRRGRTSAAGLSWSAGSSTSPFRVSLTARRNRLTATALAAPTCSDQPEHISSRAKQHSTELILIQAGSRGA